MADLVRSQVDGPRYIPVLELRDGGYLQEVNRRFFHPLGLALEIGIYEEPGRWFTLRDEDVARLARLANMIREAEPDEAAALDDLIARSTPLEQGDGVILGVWDCRDDPEGVIFGDGLLDPAKAHRVTDEMNLRALPRMATLGYVVQDVQLPDNADV